MALTIYVNTGSQDTELNSSGSSWVEIDTISDEIIFTKGNDTVKDGELIPSSSQLSSAAPVIDGNEYVFAKHFLSDVSAGIIKEITNMGGGNHRYVMAFDFSALTVSEPVLEIWDDVDLDSINSTILGAGTAASSWYRGITTTDALPGASWTGSRLAGSSDGHFLFLNSENGALSGADTLYCQLRLVLPATQAESGSNNSVIAVKYATV